MAEHKIKITELLETTVIVETDSTDDAMDRVKAMYRNSEIVLSADDHTGTEFTAAAGEPSDDGRICDCGHKSFAAQQVSYHHVVVTGNNVFDAGVLASRQPYGQFVCTKCNKIYDDLTPETDSTRGREGDV